MDQLKQLLPDSFWQETLAAEKALRRMEFGLPGFGSLMMYGCAVGGVCDDGTVAF